MSHMFTAVCVVVCISESQRTTRKSSAGRGAVSIFLLKNHMLRDQEEKLGTRHPPQLISLVDRRQRVRLTATPPTS